MFPDQRLQTWKVVISIDEIYGTFCLKSQFKLNYGIIYAFHSMRIQVSYCVFILETIFRSIV